jgi:hypothetical protein
MHRDREAGAVANPTLRCYPRDDPQFLADAQEALTESRWLASRSQQMLEEVRRKLKERYPAVRVEPRNRLASGDGLDDVWYCYRDGTLVA